MDFLLATLDVDSENGDTGDMERCCGAMMVYHDPMLVCEHCGRMRTVEEDYAPGAKIVNSNTRIVVRRGNSNQQRWGASAMSPAELGEEAVRLISDALTGPVLGINLAEYPQLLASAGKVFSDVLVHVGNTKPETRWSLMAACTFYQAVACGLYVSRSNLAAAFGLKVKGISIGERRLRCWVMHRKVELDMNIDTIPTLAHTYCKKVGLARPRLVMAVVNYMIDHNVRPRSQTETKAAVAILYVSRLCAQPVNLAAISKTKHGACMTQVRALERCLSLEGVDGLVDIGRAYRVFGAGVDECEGGAVGDKVLLGLPAPDDEHGHSLEGVLLAEGHVDGQQLAST